MLGITDHRACFYKIYEGIITVALAIANLPVVYRYLGGPAAVIYTAGFATFIALLRSKLLTLVFIRRLVIFGVFISLIAQTLLLWWLAPIYDGRMDRDEALVCFLTRLKGGYFPYNTRTSLGNPISVLPFMPLLAVPFVLLGNVGYLEIFSYLVLVGLLKWYYRYRPRIETLSLGVLSSAPLVFLEVTGRSDLIANMVLVMALVLLIQSDEHVHHPLLTGILLGCALATRIALFPVFMTVIISLICRLKWQDFARIALVSAVSFALLLLPFLFWDACTFIGFAPIGVNATKLGSSIIARIVWPVLTALVATACGIYASKTRFLTGFIIPPIILVVAAVWISFAIDITYLQLIFIPLLFAFPANKAEFLQRK